MDIVLEIGKKRVFAAALDWPGWCRSGRDESAAQQALFEYGLRYARAIETARLGFQPPRDISTFMVIERLDGNAGTDFGAPNVPPSADAQPVTRPELEKFQALLEALWRFFDKAVLMAEGKELQKGPRGGGRDLDGIVQHVLQAEHAYLVQLGGKLEGKVEPSNPREGFAPVRKAIVTALGAAYRGELPSVGPRGGRRWSLRFYVRYSAWHLLDHTWELEDRVL